MVSSEETEASGISSIYPEESEDLNIPTDTTEIIVNDLPEAESISEASVDSIDISKESISNESTETAENNTEELSDPQITADNQELSVITEVPTETETEQEEDTSAAEDYIEEEEYIESLSSGADIIQANLNYILQIYPSGSYFSANGQACGHAQSSTCSNCELYNIPSRGGLPSGNNVGADDSWTCVGFAKYMFYCLSGAIWPDKNNTVYTNVPYSQVYQKAQLGDYISYSGHAGIYLYGDSSGYYMYEANYGTVNKVMYAGYKHTEGPCKIVHAYCYEYPVPLSNDTVPPVISNVVVTNLSSAGYNVSCTVTDNVGVTRVAFPTWTDQNGQDDLVWFDGTISGNTATVWIDVRNHNNEVGCTYTTHIYAYDAAGNYSTAGVGDIMVPATEYAFLDVNGLLDGTSYGSTAGYGTFDVYINGSLVANDVGDYCTQWPVGTSYSISDIKAYTGKAYRGVYEGSVSGSIRSGNTYVQLKYSTKYTITYNANGGTGAPSAQVKYYGENISLTTGKPERENYNFLGWATTPSATASEYSSGSTYSKNASVTLYAVWQQTVELWVFSSFSAVAYGTFDVYINGTKVADDVENYSVSWPIGTSYSISDIKAYSGYAYRGLNYGSLSGNIYMDDEYPGIDFVHLKFSAKYTISYNANGGTGAPSAQIKYEGENITLSSQKPTRSGYVFDGWATSSSATASEYYSGSTYSQDTSITLYAVWKTVQQGWKQVNGAWYYYDSNGNVVTGLQQINGKYYYFDKSTGAEKVGWVVDNGKYYYFSPTDGTMTTGWLLYNGKYYFFDRNTGVEKVGFVYDGGKCYYFDKNNGEEKVGWVLDGGYYYYFSPTDGTITLGWLLYNGKYYFFDRTYGNEKVGWVLDGGKYYFFDRNNGQELVGWVKDNGKWYFFDRTNGAEKVGWVLDGGKYYYFSPENGALVTGWLKYNNSWYYMDPVTGLAVTGTQVIDGKTYIFDSNGVCIG